MLNIWTQPSGYDFGIFPEQVAIDLPLPVTSDTGVTYQVISGALPGGVQIIGNHLKGNPYIVSNLQIYQFCIRATLGTTFSDRTYKIEIDGRNIPVYTTPAGDLAVGPNKQLYALDGSYVNYQIEAFDLNVELGNKLRYFIASGDGQLPPGITLSDSGLLSGFVTPNLILTPEAGTGEFDQAYYDDAGYDFSLIPTDGFDSYQYDDVFFDYNMPSTLPKSLNANYQFRVTVTDGISFAQRVFKIFIIGNDEFRADSTSLDGFAGSFTADSTFLRTPVWLSDTNLGTFRANNYLTVPVVLYDKTSTIFRLETTNCESYAVTKRVALTDNIIGKTTVTVTNVTIVPTVGQYFTFDNYVSTATSQTYQISNVTNLGNGYYRLNITTPLLINVPDLVGFYIGTLGALPPGTKFDINTGEIYGKVPYQPSITKSYKFTITATRISSNINDQVISHKQFNIIILGTITSQITWVSPNNLGTIPADYTCNLSVQASSNISSATVLYTLVGGTLPYGLTLNLDGEIVGTPNQFYDVTTGKLGVTTFYDNSTSTTYKNQTFDFGATTTDRTFNFTVRANDQYEYSAVTKTFTITLTTPNTVPYSNITTKPFLNPTQRSAWQAFINDANIFTPSSVYRPTDANFGLQSNLTMLVYAGIQTEEAGAYVGAMGLGFKKKQFKFGSLKTATAIDPATGNVVYEVIYVQMIDPLESKGKYLPLTITTPYVSKNAITVDENITVSYLPDPLITVDSTGYETSNPNVNRYFPNSISNWQNRLRQTTDHFDNNGNSVPALSERNYLPLWMRSIPNGSKSQLGYILAVPLCFCKPGTSSKIVLNIKNSEFNFNIVDYTVDRFIISAVTGYTSDKYLVFRNDRITI